MLRFEQLKIWNINSADTKVLLEIFSLQHGTSNLSQTWDVWWVFFLQKTARFMENIFNMTKYAEQGWGKFLRSLLK